MGVLGWGRSTNCSFKRIGQGWPHWGKPGGEGLALRVVQAEEAGADALRKVRTEGPCPEAGYVGRRV